MKIDFPGCNRRRQPGAPGCPGGEKLFMKNSAQAGLLPDEQFTLDGTMIEALAFKSLLREDVSQVGDFINYGY
jgi:hypothetical protein